METQKPKKTIWKWHWMCDTQIEPFISDNLIGSIYTRCSYCVKKNNTIDMKCIDFYYFFSSFLPSPLCLFAFVWLSLCSYKQCTLLCVVVFTLYRSMFRSLGRYLCVCARARSYAKWYLGCWQTQSNIRSVLQTSRSKGSWYDWSRCGCEIPQKVRIKRCSAESSK